MPKNYLSLIIPCYNEGATFENSVSKILSVLKKEKNPWEIIFVEDKSTDHTRSAVEKLLKKIKNSSAIFHSKNQGRGKSVSDGILKARGDICGFLDVDLEVSADYIPLFVTEIEKGADMAVGERFYEGENSLTRFLASKLYVIIVRLLLDVPIEDTESGYKFFNRKRILPIVKKTKNKHWFWDTEICARAHKEGLKISQVPVLFRRRADKKSTVKLIPDTWHYLTSIIKFRAQLKSQT